MGTRVKESYLSRDSSRYFGTHDLLTSCLYWLDIWR